MQTLETWGVEKNTNVVLISLYTLQYSFIWPCNPFPCHGPSLWEISTGEAFAPCIFRWPNSSTLNIREGQDCCDPKCHNWTVQSNAEEILKQVKLQVRTSRIFSLDWALQYVPLMQDILRWFDIWKTNEQLEYISGTFTFQTCVLNWRAKG